MVERSAHTRGKPLSFSSGHRAACHEANQVITSAQYCPQRMLKDLRYIPLSVLGRSRRNPDKTRTPFCFVTALRLLATQSRWTKSSSELYVRWNHCYQHAITFFLEILKFESILDFKHLSTNLPQRNSKIVV